MAVVAESDAVTGSRSAPSEGNAEAVAEVIAALTYGERRAAERAEKTIALAPDGRTRNQQTHVAELEKENLALLEARLAEVGSPELEDRFRPFFDAFFESTEPADWVQAQTFHYIGDSLVSDFARDLTPVVDRVSAEMIRRALGQRDEQDAFALDQITGALREDPGTAERVAAYARIIVGEALTQTRRALDETEVLQTLLGGEEGEKRVLLDLLDGHRRRLDRLGIEPVE